MLTWQCALVTGGLLLTLIIAGNLWVVGAGGERLHHATDSIPQAEVGLVLGAAPTLGNGRRNLFFQYRMQAAAELYHAGKVRGLLVSGDNGQHSYDEATAMYEALQTLGVPAEHITRDYAGFRTLDSVIRAKAVFGAESLTIVSQAFHCQRALFIADAHDVQAQAYTAAAVSARNSIRTRIREYGARLLAIGDCYLWGREPRFYGPPEHLHLAKAITSQSNKL